MDERRLAGSVRSEQTDRAARQRAAQIDEDRAPAEADAEPVQLDDRRFGPVRMAHDTRAVALTHFDDAPSHALVLRTRRSQRFSLRPCRQVFFTIDKRKADTAEGKAERLH